MSIGRLCTGIIIVLIALLVLDPAMQFLNPPVDERKDISRNGYFANQVTLMGEDRITGNFTVRNDTVTFFICNDTDYRRFRDERCRTNITAHALKENASSGDFTFKTPKTDSVTGRETWHVVFDAADSSGEKVVVEYTIECTAYRNIIYYTKIVFLLFGSVRIMQGLFGKKRPDKVPSE